MDKRLDWKPRFDDRSRMYGIRPLLGTSKKKKKPTFWQEGTVLDQGAEGACVGFGWLAEIIAKPVVPDEQPTEEVGNHLAQFYYEEAKKLDEWEGQDYEGTSVLAGAKVMKKYGLISEYRWCFNIDDIIDAVATQGPVVIGIPWYNSMYTTNSQGLCGVSGEKVGGHCITLTGYDPAKVFGRQTVEVFRWRNSWGEEYGVNGSGYIRVSDLRKLFAEGGEACIPIVRNKPNLAFPPKSIIKKRTFWDYLLTAIVNWFKFRFFHN